MVSTGVLVIAAAILVACWIVLGTWVLVERALYDRLESQAHLDNEAHLAGSLDLSSLSHRRLVRLALGPASPAACAAAEALLAANRSELLARARTMGNDNGRLHALTILIRAGLPYGVGLIRRAAREGDVALTTSLLRLAAELDSAVADALLLDLLVDGTHPRSRTATELEPRTSRVRNELSALVSHEDPALRYWAILLLQDEMSDATAALAVTSRAGDRDANVRAAVAEALGGIDAHAARPLLRRLLRDDAFFVRSHAARAVAKVGDQSFADELLPLLADQNWWVRAAAKESLLSLGKAGLETARAALQHPDRFARDGALEIILDAGGIPELIADAADGDAAAQQVVTAIRERTGRVSPVREGAAVA